MYSTWQTVAYWRVSIYICTYLLFTQTYTTCYSYMYTLSNKHHSNSIHNCKKNKTQNLIKYTCIFVIVKSVLNVEYYSRQ